jgi:ABC-2 type transport system permease protein
VTGAALVAHQTRYDLRAFTRNREARFFTVLLPLIFLVIFAAVFGNDTVIVDGREIKQTTYYVPNLMALAIVSAAVQSLVIAVVTQRESGILKRRRSTPVPAWALIAGRALTSVVVVFTNFVALALVGVVFYGVDLPGATLPATLVTVALGGAALCCVGFAIATFVRSEDAAAPVVQAITLPLFFISGVFIPDDNIPDGLLTVASAFPVRPLAQSLLHAYDPATTGAGFAWGHLAVVAAWGAAGLAIAARRFKWTPQGR